MPLTKNSHYRNHSNGYGPSSPLPLSAEKENDNKDKEDSQADENKEDRKDEEAKAYNVTRRF